jgi:hypothetical protein
MVTAVTAVTALVTALMKFVDIFTVAGSILAYQIFSSLIRL